MLKRPEVAAFLQSPAFFPGIQAVQADDARSSEFQGEWTAKPLGSCFLFEDPANSWPVLQPTF